MPINANRYTDTHTQTDTHTHTHTESSSCLFGALLLVCPELSRPVWSLCSLQSPLIGSSSAISCPPHITVGVNACVVCSLVARTSVHDMWRPDFSSTHIYSKSKSSATSFKSVRLNWNHLMMCIKIYLWLTFIKLFSTKALAMPELYWSWKSLVCGLN